MVRAMAEQRRYEQVGKALGAAWDRINHDSALSAMFGPHTTRDAPPLSVEDFITRRFVFEDPFIRSVVKPGRLVAR